MELNQLAFCGSLLGKEYCSLQDLGLCGLVLVLIYLAGNLPSKSPTKNTKQNIHCAS